MVSGGVDDTLHLFDRVGSRWRENGSSPIRLGHTSGIGIDQKPMAQGVAVTPDGSRAVVANRYNASVTVVDLISAKVVKEIDLRPGVIDRSQSGTAGGEFPVAICIEGKETAFVSSERDREIVVVDLGSQAVVARVPVSGNPNRMILNRDASRLFVALDNADVVAVIDTQRRVVIDEIQTVAPPGMLRLAKRYRGASPNAMALAADEKTLFVTNRGTNSVAVIDNDDAARQVRGLIPTGWYPSDLVVGPGEVLYIVNTQSVPGPNGGNCLGYQTVPCPVRRTPVRFAANEYILDLSKGGLLSLPLPRAEVLPRLTRQVAANNRFESANRDSQVMEALHARSNT